MNLFTQRSQIFGSIIYLVRGMNLGHAATLHDEFSAWVNQPRSTPVQVVADWAPPHRLHANRDLLPILVVGAGPAGLAAMRALELDGLVWEGVEKAAGVGGIWREGHGPMPASASLAAQPQSSWWSSWSSWATTYLEIPPLRGGFLSRRQAAQDLTAFAQEAALVDRIKFGTEVRELRQLANGIWEVEMVNAQRDTVVRAYYQGVVLATGWHNTYNRRAPKRLRSLASVSGITLIHAAEYLGNQGLRGKEVVIVGMGNTASAIATEVSRVTRRTVISSSRVPWIVPKELWGVPADQIAALMDALPYGCGRWVLGALQYWCIRRRLPRSWPTTTHGFLERPPVLDTGLVQALHEGRIDWRPMIANLVAGRISYRGMPTSAFWCDRPDLIIVSGYRRKLPPFARRFTPQSDYLFHVIHPERHGLIVLNEVVVPQGSWPMSWAQARVVAAYFQAARHHPERVEQLLELAAARKLDFKGGVFSRSDPYHVHPRRYAGLLAELRSWLLHAP